MKIQELLNEDFHKRQNVINEMVEKLKGGQDPTIKHDVLATLRDDSIKIGSHEKNIAIGLVEKTKMTDAVPSLYPLLKVTIVSGIGEKVKQPVNAMIAIGKEGIPELLRCVEEDDDNSVPYQVVASILYHWFGSDRKALHDFLVENRDTRLNSKNKFDMLIDVVEKWK